MNLHNHSHGTRHDAIVRLPSPSRALTGTVELTRSANGFYAMQQGRRCPLVPRDRKHLNTLRILCDAGDRAVIRLEAPSGQTQLLSACVMRRAERLAEPLRIAVPNEVAEHMGRGPAQDWAQYQLVDDGRLLAWAGDGRDVELRGSFRLLGAHKELLVQWDDEHDVLVAVKVERSRGRSGPTLLLGGLELTALDHAVPHEVSEDVHAAPLNSATLALWEDYRQLDDERVQERAKKVGSVAYSSYRTTADGIWFKLEDTRADSVRHHALGLELQTETIDDDGSTARVGSVTSKRDNKHSSAWLFCELDEAPPRIQSSGTLTVFTAGDTTRLRRQKDALEHLRSGLGVLPDLLAILDGRGRTQRSEPIRPAVSPSVREHLGFDLTPQQAHAVDVALNTPDIALIQGPPGTGKTTVIQALVQRLHDEGRAPVLVSSYQHQAVRRAISGLVSGDLPVLRIGGRSNESVTDKVEELLSWRDGLVDHLDNLMETLDRPPVAALSHQIRSRVRAWRRDPAGVAGTEALLDELERKAGSFWSSDVHRDLAVVRAAMRQPQADISLDNADRDALRQLLAGQRLDRATWVDGGPQQLRRLQRFVRRQPVFSDDLRQRLAHVGDDTDALSKLIDELRPYAEPPDDAWHPSPALLDLLARMVAELEQRAKRQGAGISDCLLDFRDTLREDAALTKLVLSKYAEAFAATVQQSVGKSLQAITETFDTVIIDEAARATPLDLLIPLLRGRRIVLVGDHKQLPHMVDDELASKLLAGDDNEDRSRALKQSFFERLFELYSTAPPGGMPRTVTLTDQFRMEPAVSDWLSEQFYEGTLSTHSSRQSTPPLPLGGICDHIAWFDVRGREERHDSTWRNPQEVERVMALVHQALRQDDAGSIGIISFYRGQVQLLQEQVKNAGYSDRVKVGTVDAFQGHEYDIVLLSCVRASGRVGFVRSANRLNVAMSRARRFLGVVGHLETMQHLPALDSFARLCARQETLC